MLCSSLHFCQARRACKAPQHYSMLSVSGTHIVHSTTNASAAACEPSVANRYLACGPTWPPVERTMHVDACVVRRLKSDTVPSMSLQPCRCEKVHVTCEA